MNEKVELDSAAAPQEEERILSIPETCCMVNKSAATLNRDERAGLFPQRVRTGVKSVGYRLSEVRAWMKSLPSVTTENSVSVAVPKEGRRRGRRKKTEITAIEKFSKAMTRNGLITQDSLVVDGNIHFLDSKGRHSGTGCTWYVLNVQNPAVGLFGCLERNICRKWLRPTFESMNENEKVQATEKLEDIRAKKTLALRKQEADHE